MKAWHKQLISAAWSCKGACKAFSNALVNTSRPWEMHQLASHAKQTGCSLPSLSSTRICQPSRAANSLLLFPPKPSLDLISLWDFQRSRLKRQASRRLSFACGRGRVTKWPQAFYWMLRLAFQEVLACRTPIGSH